MGPYGTTCGLVHPLLSVQEAVIIRSVDVLRDIRSELLASGTVLGLNNGFISSLDASKGANKDLPAMVLNDNLKMNDVNKRIVKNVWLVVPKLYPCISQNATYKV